MRSKSDLHTIEQELAAHGAAEGAGGSANRRTTATTSRRVWAITVLPVITAAVEGIQAEFARQFDNWFGQPPGRLEPFELDDQVRAGRSYFHSGLGALGVEVLLSVWLLVSFVRMPVAFAVLVGIGLAIFFSYAAKSGFGAVRARLADTPAVARDRLGRAAWRLLWVSCASFSVFLLGRSASGIIATVVVFTLPISLAILSISLPLLAGACFVAADLLMWSRRLTTRWQRAKLLEGRVTSLADQDRPERTGPNRADRAVRAATLVGAIAVAILANANGVRGAEGADRGHEQGYIFVDTSDSGARKVYLSLVDELAERVDRLASGGVTSWRTVPFVDHGFYAAGTKFEFPGFSPSACVRTRIEGEAEAMFETVRAELERRDSERCRTERAEAEARQRRARAVELERLRNELRTAATNERASCSGLMDVLSRVATSHAGVVIIVSDGLETCRGLAPVAAPAGRTRAFLILISSRAAPGRYKPAFDSRAASLRAVVPWMTILAPFQLDELR